MESEKQKTTPIVSTSTPKVKQTGRVKRILILVSSAILLSVISAVGGYYFALNTHPKNESDMTNATIQISSQKQNPYFEQNDPEPAIEPARVCSTYTNQKYKFSINCPSGWLIEEVSEDYDTGMTLAYIIPPETDKIRAYEYITPKFFIEITDTPFSESPKGNKDIDNDPEVIRDWKQITVSGITGHYYNSMNCAPMCPTRFDIPYDNGKKTLTIGKVEITKEEIRDIEKETGILIENATNERYLQIINSFRFIE